MSKSYLVTGGTGFIGSALVTKLVKLGYRVKVFDDNSRGNLSRLAEVSSAIEFVSGDIRDLTALSKVVQEVDGVFHLAAVNGTEYFYTKPDVVLEVGVKGICNILDACIKHSIKELIVASSAEVYQTASRIPTDETAPLVIPDPLNKRYSYAASKLISEVMAINNAKHFNKLCIFRPHNIYGPNMGGKHVIPQLILKIAALSKQSNSIDLPIQGTGTETRAFCYIDDLIDGLALLLASTEKSSIYHIGTTQEVSIATLVSNIASLLNCKINIIPGTLTAGSTMRRCPDISKMIQLGYKPKVSLQEGLQKTIEWYLENIDCYIEQENL